jgi:hypothetical protein
VLLLVDQELIIMSPAAWSILQIAVSVLCAAAAFGVLLSTMLVRTNQRFSSEQGAQFDVAYTERTYGLASILASIGALASFQHSLGTFASFVGVAISFQIAEHWLLPNMRAAADSGETMPMVGVRSRFELLQAACLIIIFSQVSMPPLFTLARVYGV